MVRLRVQKKHERKVMQCKREDLEKQVKRGLADLNRTILVPGGSERARKIYRLALESDALRTENVKFQEKLQHHERLHSFAQEELLDINHCRGQDSRNTSVYAANKKSRWVSRLKSDVPGWHACFPDGGSSFYFRPFPREEFDRTIKTCIGTFGHEPPVIDLESVGTLFGWKMHYAPLTRRQEDNTLVAHAIFTIRFGSSLGEINESLVKMGLNSLLLIATPPNWNARQRRAVCADATRVREGCVRDGCSIPGPVSLRFIYLLSRLSRTLSNGKRVVTYIMVIAGTLANKRSREVEGSLHDVEWVHEGRTYLTLTEVDGGAVDLNYDHWVHCRDEHHAQSLFLQWVEFVSRWSQNLFPLRLLE